MQLLIAYCSSVWCAHTTSSSHDLLWLQYYYRLPFVVSCLIYMVFSHRSTCICFYFTLDIRLQELLQMSL